MYARVSTVWVPPERTKEARQQIVEQALPAAKALPGSTAAFWLSDDERLVSVVVYDTEVNLIGNREASNAIRSRTVGSLGGIVRAVEEFEVIAEVWGREDRMEKNKAIARRIYDEVLNQRRLDLLEELVRPDYVEHHPLPGQREGVEGIRDRYRMLIEGLDAHFSVEDVIAEGDRVVVRWVNRGTNIGEFLGAPATNRPFSTEGIDIYRIEDGKLAEHWHVVDLYGQMVQLGQLPAPAVRDPDSAGDQ
jgi:predicted ester cyclase